MVRKQMKGKQRVVKKTPQEQLHALWLAGLGAVAVAQQRGGELFGGFMNEGKDLRVRARKLAQRSVARFKAQLEATTVPLQQFARAQAAQFETAVQHRFSRVLARLGVPTKADVDALSRRVAVLSRRLKTAK